MMNFLKFCVVASILCMPIYNASRITALEDRIKRLELRHGIEAKKK